MRHLACRALVDDVRRRLQLPAAKIRIRGQSRLRSDRFLVRQRRANDRRYRHRLGQSDEINKEESTQNRRRDLHILSRSKSRVKMLQFKLMRVKR